MNLKQFIQSKHTKKPHFVLFGNPVAHSLSPLMHNTAAGYFDMEVRYHAVRLEKEEHDLVESFLKNEHLKGVNLTIPFKYDFLKYCNELEPVAESIKATNALVKIKTVWKGYNTDVYGFSVPLKSYKKQIKNKNAIIFGSGGAAKAVAYAIRDLGMREITIVSRNPEEADATAKQLSDRVVTYKKWIEFAENAALFVNATPLGMKPNLDKSPVKDNSSCLLKNAVCYDLIYNPSKTKFLKQAENAGAKTINGLDMLIYQGSKLFELWTGKTFPIPLIKKTLSITTQ